MRVSFLSARLVARKTSVTHFNKGLQEHMKLLSKGVMQMMEKFRDHSWPETKCDVGPLRLCPSDHSRFLIFLPSGLEAKIFFNFEFISGC